MPQTKRRRGWKACDPFCSDKVRKALYNRPNGPHQGKLILGKTYLSGIDGKCFSRTGRIKRGYRNVPVDIEREFEIEKRQIKQIQNMIRGPSQKIKNRRTEKKKLQKTQYEQEKKDNNLNNLNNLNLMEQQKTNNDQLPTQKIMNHEIQKMDKLSRFKNESFGHFVSRVNKTTSYHLNEKKHRQNQQRLRKREKNLEKRLKREQRKIEAKRMRKLEDSKRRKEQREFEERIKPKKEYIPFGATNDRPPVDLHKLGEKLIGKRINNKIVRNENNLNISGLSFTNIIQRRAEQIKKQEILKNYAMSKQKRYKKRKRKVWN